MLGRCYVMIENETLLSSHGYLSVGAVVWPLSEARRHETTCLVLRGLPPPPPQFACVERYQVHQAARCMTFWAGQLCLRVTTARCDASPTRSGSARRVNGVAPVL